MALYAIGDLHLSLGADKPMDVFGGPWENYVEKIRLGFSALHDDDVCVLCGDLAWGMTMEQALPDFQFIEALPVAFLRIFRAPPHTIDLTGKAGI